MRRLDKQITDESIINEIISKSLICRIAFFDKEYPYVVPMNYGYHENSLYFHCATEGKKIDLIRKNNKVGFEIVHKHELIKKKLSCGWTTEYRSILGTGKIDVLTGYNEKKMGLDIIMKQHGREENTYSESAVEKVVILKLSIKSLSAKQAGEW